MKCEYVVANGDIVEVIKDGKVCPNCGEVGCLVTPGKLTQEFKLPITKGLRPPHYTKGKDTFAWAEETLTKEACLAIAAFNIHKYNTRNKGQDYEDFGKIIEYANWARSLTEKE